MSRQRIGDKPMTPVERRQRSDDERRARGQVRLTCWLTPEGSAALDYMLKLRDDVQHGDRALAVSSALVYLAQANGMQPLTVTEAVESLTMPGEGQQ